MNHPGSTTLATASLIVLAAACAPQARAAPEPVAALPTTCNASSGDPVATDQWTKRNFDPAHSTRLMELKWIAQPERGPQLGRIECIYAPYVSRFPYPTLISEFPVHRPVTPGWMPPSPGADWLLCSGATMTRFDDPNQCPFVPAAAGTGLGPPRDGGSLSPF